MALLTKDQINLFSKLTFRKSWNALLINFSFFLSNILKSNIQWGMPYAFSVEPTTSCNLRCPECPSGLRSFTRATGSIPLTNFKQIVDSYSKKAFYLTLYFQGEPYLNKEFLNLVSYAHQKKLYIATSTNAHYLDKETAIKTVKSGLDRLIVSIDGTTQSTYESYRVGGNLEKVKEGLKNIITAKKELKSSTPYVVLQFLVVGPNEHQIEEVKALGETYGADEVKLKTAQIYNFKHGSPLIPKNEKYARYIQQKDGTYKLKNSLENECWRMWHSNVVTWDGDVVPCCFDKDAKYVMGNVLKNDLTSIWKNKKYNSFRTQLFTNRNNIDICQNCTEGSKIYSD